VRKRKARKESKNVERDMAIARSVAPKELGGGGLDQGQAAEQFGLTRQRVQQILHEPDVQEAHKSWLHGMFKKQRGVGDKVQAAFEALVDAQDARVVIDYFRRMGVDVGPGTDVNIEKLELTIPKELTGLLKLNPAFVEEQNENRSQEADETESTEPAGQDS
jgi:hypothetical protein